MIIKKIEIDKINLSKLKYRNIEYKRFLFNSKERFYILNREINFKITFLKKYTDVYKEREIFGIIPIGFISNGRTVMPKFLKKFIKQIDTEIDEINLFHDWIYNSQYISEFREKSYFIDKVFSDKIRLEYMLKSGKVSKILSKVEYFILRIFGKYFYNKSINVS
jgi:hypothetical protein